MGRQAALHSIAYYPTHTTAINGDPPQLLSGTTRPLRMLRGVQGSCRCGCARQTSAHHTARCPPDDPSAFSLPTKHGLSLGSHSRGCVAAPSIRGLCAPSRCANCANCASTAAGCGARRRRRCGRMLSRLTALVGGGSTLPFELGEEFPSSSSFCGWKHWRGTSRADGSPVSIFRVAAASKSVQRLEAARNAARRLRMLRVRVWTCEALLSIAHDNQPLPPRLFCSIPTC